MLKTIYSNSALTIATTNPQISDANGDFSGDIFLDGVYDIRLQDANDVTIYTLSDINEVPNRNFTLWSSTATYDIPDIVVGSDDNFYKSLIDSNTNNNPTSSPSQWARLEFITAGEVNVNTKFNNSVRWSKGADLASAASLIPGTDGNYFDVTGTTAITSIADVSIGTVIKLHFDGILTLTHNATDLILPNNANIVTAAGDEAELVQYAAGDWRLTNYQRADFEYMTQGTWTPLLQDANFDNSEGQVYNDTSTSGTWIRMGNLIHIRARLRMTSVGTLSGDAYLAGLPFTAASSSGPHPLSVGNVAGVSITSSETIAAEVDAGGTVASLHLWDSASGTTRLQISELAATFDINIAGTYYVD